MKEKSPESQGFFHPLKHWFSIHQTLMQYPVWSANKHTSIVSSSMPGSVSDSYNMCKRHWLMDKWVCKWLSGRMNAYDIYWVSKVTAVCHCNAARVALPEFQHTRHYGWELAWESLLDFQFPTCIYTGSCLSMFLVGLKMQKKRRVLFAKVTFTATTAHHKPCVGLQRDILPATLLVFIYAIYTYRVYVHG